MEVAAAALSQRTGNKGDQFPGSHCRGWEEIQSRHVAPSNMRPNAEFLTWGSLLRDEPVAWPDGRGTWRGQLQQTVSATPP